MAPHGRARARRRDSGEGRTLTAVMRPRRCSTSDMISIMSTTACTPPSCRRRRRRKSIHHGAASFVDSSMTEPEHKSVRLKMRLRRELSSPPVNMQQRSG